MVSLKRWSHLSAGKSRFSSSFSSLEREFGISEATQTHIDSQEGLAQLGVDPKWIIILRRVRFKSFAFSHKTALFLSKLMYASQRAPKTPWNFLSRLQIRHALFFITVVSTDKRESSCSQLSLVLFEKVLQRKGFLGSNVLPCAGSGEGRMMGGIKREQGRVASSSNFS